MLAFSTYQPFWRPDRRPDLSGTFLTWVLPSVGVVLLTCGACSERPNMQLGRAETPPPADLAWWYVSFDDGPRAPIVGVEIPQVGPCTDQWILADRGVRRFRYTGSRLTAAGPPLPTSPTPSDIDPVRQWLCAYLPRVAPQRALPTEALRRPLLEPSAGPAKLTMQEVVALLRDYWPDAQIRPPAGMSPLEIADQIEAFPHGVTELLDVVRSAAG
jgi:hypothetical protein